MHQFLVLVLLSLSVMGCFSKKDREEPGSPAYISKNGDAESESSLEDPSSDDTDLESNNEMKARPLPSLSTSFSSNAQDKLFKSSSSKYFIKVVEIQKFSELLRDKDKFAVGGTIYDIQNLDSSDHHILKMTMCSLKLLERRDISVREIKNKFFSVETSREEVHTDDNASRSLAFSFNELGIGVVCTKTNDVNKNFTWSEIRKAFGPILKMVAVDEAQPLLVVGSENFNGVYGGDENCSEELQLEIMNLGQEFIHFGQNVLKLSQQISSSISENEKLQYQEKMNQEVSEITQECERFQKKWGKFSCKSLSSDGKEAFSNSRELKESCDQIKTQL